MTHRRPGRLQLFYKQEAGDMEGLLCPQGFTFTSYGGNNSISDKSEVSALLGMKALDVTPSWRWFECLIFLSLACSLPLDVTPPGREVWMDRWLTLWLQLLGWEPAGWRRPCRPRRGGLRADMVPAHQRWVPLRPGLLQGCWEAPGMVEALWVIQHLGEWPEAPWRC